MSIETIRSTTYKDFIEQHIFFQLTPFMEHNNNTKSVLIIDNQRYDIVSKALTLCKESLERQHDSYWSCRARSYFIELIHHVERLYYDNDIVNQDKSLEIHNNQEGFSLILDFININIEIIKMSDICKNFGLNRTKIAMLFNKNLGMSFKKYVSKQKIEKVYDMLRFTNLPISEISSRLGFSSIQNFCKFFNKHTSISPLQYRINCVQKRKAL